MNPNKALWEKGDFTRIAASMRESGDELVDKLGVKKGMKVLDLGCGDGTTALPEAEPALRGRVPLFPSDCRGAGAGKPVPSPPPAPGR